jgi:uncharacterized membrane protein YhaH (DUF805 family)
MKLFSFRGRTPRSSFWWVQILAAVAFMVLFVFLADVAGRASTLILYPFYLWIALAAAARRMHDRARSPAWLLVALVPVLGPLWLFVDLGLLRGTPGENQYGEDPLTAGTDYLTVRIGA